MSIRQNNAPIAGLRVIDFSHFIAGPICTMLLGDMGADVIKIENISDGDSLRRFPPMVDGQSAAFLWANRNKRGMAVDLKKAEGIAIAKELIATADVVVENFSSGVMERFGLGYETVSSLNDRLIYCSISAYGRDGELAHRTGFDPMIQAETGFMSLNGFPDGPGVKTGPAIMDITTGMMATNAVLGALAARTRTGKGQHTEVCLFDVATLMLGFHASSHLVSGVNPSRTGNTSPDSAPTGVFNAADGPLYIVCPHDRAYQRLVSCLNRDDLASHPDFETNASRLQNRGELTAILEQELQRRSRDEWLPALRDAGVAVAPVRTVKEAFDSQEMKARGLVTSVPSREEGMVPNIGSPLRFHSTPVVAPVAAPHFGEHTEEILAQLLNYGEEKIEALKSVKAIL